MGASALLVFFFSACLLFPVAVEGKDFLDVGQTSVKEIDFDLDELLAGRDAAAPESTDRLENSLRPMYKALPKDKHGRLEHTSVRYALHRLLVKERGWYVKGLEPDGGARNSSSPGQALKAWVPAHLFDVLERRLGMAGLSLRELAAVAAAIEMAASQESRERLRAVFDLHQLGLEAQLDADKARDVLDTYMIVYMRGGNVSVAGLTQAGRALEQFRRIYDRWPELNAWMKSIQKNITTATTSLTFPVLLRIAEEIGAKYTAFDAPVCKQLKSTLRGIEGGDKAGRVPLSSFYSHGANPQSPFKFVEKKDWLRDLGTLDETKQQSPSVIVPNYVVSRPNCMEASSFYAICCKNECEDIMGVIEEHIGSPSARVDELLSLVQDVGTDTVSAPRSLPKKLQQRLSQVAEINGGRVPIHGRLFAQWLHHAFPRECPFPHEAGQTNPKTPDEWLKQTGHVSTAATAAERACHINGDCGAAVDNEDDYEDGATSVEGLLEEALEEVQTQELPWSDVEELLAVDAAAHKGGALRTLAHLGLFFGMGTAMWSAVSSAMRAARNGNGGAGSSKKAQSLKRFQCI